MDVISENLANIDTTRAADGRPYTRKVVIMEERNKSFAEVMMNSAVGSAGGGVRVGEIAEDPSPYQLVYDPDHPDANEDAMWRCRTSTSRRRWWT